MFKKKVTREEFRKVLMEIANLTGLVSESDLADKLDEVIKKQNATLDHINLEYFEEEKKESGLVEKRNSDFTFAYRFADKPKRGRPKGSKKK